MANLSNLLGVSLVGFKAGGTILINRPVKLDTTQDQVVQATAITDLVIGVATQAATSGDNVPVQLFGVAKCVLGVGGATLGDQLMCVAAASGKVGTAAGATAKSFGVALATGLVDETIPVLLACPNVNGPANT